MMALGKLACGSPDFGQFGWMRPGPDASVAALRGKWVRLVNGASGFILFELAENWVRLVNSDEGVLARGRRAARRRLPGEMGSFGISLHAAP